MNDDLRRRAELLAGRMATDPALIGVLSHEEARLMHDLQVHQIELEIQNEELRRAETALEAARARYFDLYDVAPVGYVTLGPADRIVEANLTAARLLGVERGALVGAPMTRFVVADDQDTFYLRRRRLFATGVPQVVELRMRRADDSVVWVRLEATTTPDADGTSEICRAVLSDITDEKRLGEERAQFARELQHAQKAESLGRMAGAVAHHFNNQLAVVAGNLELAKDEPALADSCLAEALLAVDKAASVSGLLLTYLGQSSGSHAPIDLSAAFEHGLPLVRAGMPGHVTLETDLPVPGCVVNANADQLRLLFTNLVTNAWEAVGELPSTIHASVRAVAAKDIPTEGRFPVGWVPRAQAYACLEVRDHGCGIDPDEIEQIFEPFFTRKFTGRGLGLPVVLGILHAHSGGMVVESWRGQESGSVFRAYLPLSSEPVEPVPVVSHQLRPGVTFGGTVLVAEDDAPLRRVLVGILKRLGFDVVAASDGLEAVELFRERRHEVRLVLCDLTMPHMDGWDTLSALRRLAPALPVILTSGYDEAHVMASLRNERPQAFLRKPFNVERLRQALGIALSARPD